MNFVIQQLSSMDFLGTMKLRKESGEFFYGTFN